MGKVQKKTILKILKKVRNLLSNKETWCQRILAVNDEGEPCHPIAHNACAFCILGAIITSSGDKNIPSTFPIDIDDLSRSSATLEYLWDFLPGDRELEALCETAGPNQIWVIDYITRLNDKNHMSRHRLLRAIDRAIQSLEK